MLLLHCPSLQTCILTICPGNLQDCISNARIKATKKPELALLDRLLFAFIIFVVYTRESESTDCQMQREREGGREGGEEHES